MAQIFHPSFNVISQVSIFGSLGILAAAGWLGYVVIRSPVATNAYVAVEQPVPFSHEHHAGRLKIDCRYCHTSVEKSDFAGMPATETCMNCHSQIWVNSSTLAPVRNSYKTGQPIVWNRVHQLAEFAHFSHAIHVNKGVGCSSCHGRVDQMPLTWQTQSLHMDWCLSCHREPEKNLRPKSEIFNMEWVPPANQWEVGKKLAEEYGVKSFTNCSVCHY